jgi:DNA modification methylase
MSDEIKLHCKYDDLIDPKLLSEHPKNRNVHSKPQIERLSSVYKYNGVRHPIIVSRQSGFIVAGHGRKRAAIKAGMKTFPVVYQDFIDTDQEYAFLISDNALSDWSELDFSSINSDIGDLDPSFNIDMLGIDGFTIDVAEKEEQDADNVPTPPIEPKTKLGDLYLLGNHRLLCGDATSITDVENLMNKEKAGFVFTDPPYGVNFQSNMREKSERFEVLKNDDKIISDWLNLLPVFSTGFVFIWTSWKVVEKWIEIGNVLGDLTNMIIWDKGGGGIGDLKKTFATDFEIALVYHRGAEITSKRIGSVWSIGKDRAIDYKHPTQKPVALAENAIKHCTNEKEIVLDLFGGSGSTLIACETTNRKCYTMELDPQYCDVIVERWERFTGKKAVLTNGAS